MLYLTRGKIKSIDNIKLPDPDAYPELVHIHQHYGWPVFGVSKDGSVWIIDIFGCKKIIGLNNMTSVFTYDPSYLINMIMINDDGKIVHASCSYDGILKTKEVCQCPEQVMMVTEKYALCSEGFLHQHIGHFQYTKIVPDTKFVMISGNRALSETGEVYANGIKTDEKSVLCIGNGIILYESGLLKHIGKSETMIQNPKDVVQVVSYFITFAVLYQGQTMFVDNQQGYIDNVDRIGFEGMLIRKREVKSSRATK